MMLKTHLVRTGLAILLALGLIVSQTPDRAESQPSPSKGSVTIAGDSITLQTALTGAAWPGALVHADIGWQVANAYPYINNDVAYGHDQVFVYALGMNDSNPVTGGWTMEDVWAERYMLALPPIPGTCEVVVLPGNGAGMSQAHKEQLVAQRIWTKYVIVPEKIAAGRKVVMVDWQTWLDADPSLVSSDGIHLPSDPNGPWGLSKKAGEARAAMYQFGIDQCRSLL